jgi:hypothetical protein
VSDGVESLSRSRFFCLSVSAPAEKFPDKFSSSNLGKSGTDINLADYYTGTIELELKVLS